MDGTTDLAMDGLLRAHQRRAEILVSCVQLGIIALFGALYFTAPMTFATMQASTLAPVPVALSAYLVISLLRLALALGDRLGPVALHLSVIADMAVLFGLIWSFHLQYGQPPAFYLKAPTLLYAFIFIALRTLRLEVGYVVAAGVAAIIGWSGLAAYAVVADGGTPLTRDYITYMTSATVLIGAEVDKLVTIAAVTAILSLAVARGRSLLLGQIGASREAARLAAETVDLNIRLTAEVAERRAAQEALHRAAYTDTLTGLGSRLALLDQLGSRHLCPVGSTLAVLDVDGFGTFNDSLGPEAGDRLLGELAARLETVLAGGTPPVRLGADEFAVILPPGSPLSPADLRDRLCGGYSHDGRSFAVTISMGTVAVTAGAGPGDLLRDADTALHQAKAQGRAQLVAFDPSVRARIEQRVALEADLRVALAGGQFRLFYQPIVALPGGQVAGYEALIRWQHPARGLIPPGQFIPITEETGQIVEIGAWALEEAASALVRLDAHAPAGAPPAFMSVNVSARQLARPDLLRRAVERAVAIAGPGRIKLEVTESLMIGDEARAIATLKELADLGATLSMDDFGTGYSSLAQLHRLPFATLKLDRSFVIGLDEGTTRPMVEAVLALARGMRLNVVAEGVETPAQRDLLSGLGCDLAQGYLFRRPVPEQELAPG
ncbi:MAG: hypothetical protein RLY86_184 [Pseudomonadota bacterium]|jgi:diguanylate cyclase (GGDEF)-like protein